MWICDFYTTVDFTIRITDRPKEVIEQRGNATPTHETLLIVNVPRESMRPSSVVQSHQKYLDTR